MKGLKKLSVLGALAVAGIVGLGSSSAKADSIEALNPTTVGFVQGADLHTTIFGFEEFQYTYNIVLTANNYLQTVPPNGISLTDFNGLVFGSAVYTPVASVGTTGTISYTPTNVFGGSSVMSDNAAIFDVNLQLTPGNTDPVTGTGNFDAGTGANLTQGDRILGTLVIDSIDAPSQVRISGYTDGNATNVLLTDTGTENYIAPGTTPFFPPVVGLPLPASAVTGGGLFGLLGLAMLLKRKAGQTA